MQRAQPKKSPQQRAWWLKTLHNWHWISSALCLIGMILFSATGITLNHASQIPAKPVVTQQHGQLPQPLLALLANGPSDGAAAAVPEPVKAWLADTLDARLGAREGEWSADEVYVALPRPGGDAWLSIDRADGTVNMERTDRGWISYFNDLHKGRNTGPWWSWFLDVFAVACLLFCITGLLLLQLHAGNRPATWPIVGLGLVIPLILALLFIH